MDAGPLSSGEERHTRALRLVDTLNTGLYAYLIAKAPRDIIDLSVPMYWKTHPAEKRRLAALYDAYWNELSEVLDRHDLAKIPAHMFPDNDDEGTFLEVRRNAAAMRELEEVTWRHVAAMDALIDGIAAGRPSSPRSPSEPGFSADQ